MTVGVWLLVGMEAYLLWRQRRASRLVEEVFEVIEGPMPIGYRTEWEEDDLEIDEWP